MDMHRIRTGFLEFIVASLHQHNDLIMHPENSVNRKYSLGTGYVFGLTMIHCGVERYRKRGAQPAPLHRHQFTPFLSSGSIAGHSHQPFISRPQNSPPPRIWQINKRGWKVSDKTQQGNCPNSIWKLSERDWDHGFRIVHRGPSGVTSPDSLQRRRERKGSQP